jgi:hypothetical protein
MVVSTPRSDVYGAVIPSIYSSGAAGPDIARATAVPGPSAASTPTPTSTTSARRPPVACRISSAAVALDSPVRSAPQRVPEPVRSRRWSPVGAEPEVATPRWPGRSRRYSRRPRGDRAVRAERRRHSGCGPGFGAIRAGVHAKPDAGYDALASVQQTGHVARFEVDDQSSVSLPKLAATALANAQPDGPVCHDLRRPAGPARRPVLHQGDGMDTTPTPCLDRGPRHHRRPRHDRRSADTHRARLPAAVRRDPAPLPLRTGDRLPAAAYRSEHLIVYCALALLEEFLSSRIGALP